MRDHVTPNCTKSKSYCMNGISSNLFDWPFNCSPTIDVPIITALAGQHVRMSAAQKREKVNVVQEVVRPANYGPVLRVPVERMLTRSETSDLGAC